MSIITFRCDSYPDQNFFILRLLQSICVIFFLLLLSVCFNSAYASCTTSGSTSATYTYTAANLNSDATVTLTGTISCVEGTSAVKYEKYICMKTVFTGSTTANSSVTLPYTVTATVGGAGSTTTTQTSDNWYGPVATSANSNNTLPYSVTIKVPARSGALTAYPTGTYVGSIQLYWDMQGASSTVCEAKSGSSGSGWDSGTVALTANYVVPTYCLLNSTSNVDFGNISDIGTTTKDYTANGAIATTCNTGTSYSIYLGDGNNRISGGYRQMTNGSGLYIPYQLYQDSSYNTIWDATGGTTAIGGTGGLSKSGNGSSQSSPVYGKIPKGVSISTTPGNYTDSVVVTVTY